ncbi:hypothetical protein COU17_00655 [Candidatus Kaiserbacteria bacterium CG10_big_fil_rev_8_21_14_0_10_49_17]|uniref:Uncharacterized protein n=1 Tax=Candidatus Kaiserbacteria bacterium CG10_big_fil_rev_8_21_14_0_10_49_17 TaxID=1974609 RepID=A0A2M6WFB0_9BACT|nr:MAG: hypothetical protein COU17_00655 [Candidatus Kaiserbacteria bacterium CG10_big_fil_rev_8_21_14_0_10_49_17]
MKWTLIIFGSVAIITGIFYMLILGVQQPSVNQVRDDAGGVLDPFGGAADYFKETKEFPGYIDVALSGGQTITAPDFRTPENQISSTTQVIGVNNTVITYPPDYLIAGGKEEAYSVIYVGLDRSFTVVLQQEPLAEVRKEAENALLKALGISPDLACALPYLVAVPYEVNAFLYNKNLGFSFCEGATTL